MTKNKVETVLWDTLYYLHYLAPALFVMLFLMYWLCSRLSTTCSPMMGPGSEELQMVAAVPDMFELKE